jgi:ribosomal protein L24E
MSLRPTIFFLNNFCGPQFSEQFPGVGCCFKAWERVVEEDPGAIAFKASKCDSAAETRRKPHPFGPLQELVNPSLADPKWMEFS